MMIVDNQLDFGQIVYLITDEDQKKRIITSFKVFPNGEILYQLSCGTNFSEHYYFEVTTDVNILTKTTN
jgi:hypothetical protein